MPKGKKRLTQREKAERAAIKKQLQADGVLPPDKPRLNRKKFAREVWEDFSEMDVYTADFYLRKAIMATVGPELHEVTSEQVGILKLMKLAVELGRKTRPGMSCGICGEHGGDPSSVEFCLEIGLTYVSCSPFRVPIARLAAAQANIRNPRA